LSDPENPGLILAAATPGTLVQVGMIYGVKYQVATTTWLTFQYSAPWNSQASAYSGKIVPI
jgi:hypothetical protein